MVQEMTKALLLNTSMGRLKEAGQLKPESVSLNKMNNCRRALENAREARDHLGGDAMRDESPLIRRRLNLETVNTYEGTEDVHRFAMVQSLTVRQLRVESTAEMLWWANR